MLIIFLIKLNLLFTDGELHLCDSISEQIRAELIQGLQNPGVPELADFRSRKYLRISCSLVMEESLLSGNVD